MIGGGLAPRCATSQFGDRGDLFAQHWNGRTRGEQARRSVSSGKVLTEIFSSHVHLTRLHGDGRVTGSLKDSGRACEALEPVNDDIAIECVEFHQECTTTTSLSTDEC